MLSDSRLQTPSPVITSKVKTIPKETPRALEEAKENQEVQKNQEITNDTNAGTITKITKTSITIKTEKGELTFDLPENVGIFAVNSVTGVSSKKISDLLVGTKVLVNYDVKTKTVIYINIQ